MSALLASVLLPLRRGAHALSPARPLLMANCAWRRTSTSPLTCQHRHYQKPALTSCGSHPLAQHANSRLSQASQLPSQAYSPVSLTVSSFHVSTPSAKAAEEPQATNTTHAVTAPPDFPLIVSQSCFDRINEVNTRKNYNPPKLLRVEVLSGGCSGYLYQIKFATETTDEDIVITQGNSTVAIDEVSADLVRGSLLTFHSNLTGKYFAVEDNPNAEAGCGCGTSFMLKEDASSADDDDDDDE